VVEPFEAELYLNSCKSGQVEVTRGLLPIVIVMAHRPFSVGFPQNPQGWCDPTCSGLDIRYFHETDENKKRLTDSFKHGSGTLRYARSTWADV
jgi:hypothetical protein